MDYADKKVNAKARELFSYHQFLPCRFIPINLSLLGRHIPPRSGRAVGHSFFFRDIFARFTIWMGLYLFVTGRFRSL